MSSIEITVVKSFINTKSFKKFEAGQGRRGAKYLPSDRTILRGINAYKTAPSRNMLLPNIVYDSPSLHLKLSESPSTIYVISLRVKEHLKLSNRDTYTQKYDYLKYIICIYIIYTCARARACMYVCMCVCLCNYVYQSNPSLCIQTNRILVCLIPVSLFHRKAKPIGHVVTYLCSVSNRKQS